MDELQFQQLREEMVRRQLMGRDITDPRVLDAMRSVPRHLFVPEKYWEEAYSDYPLPIDENQTISQPYIVALMTQALNLQGDETVLEVGCGSGYQAAILSQLAKQVYTIERYASLAEKARCTLQQCGIKNVEVIVGDGSLGLKEYAPYDGIIVTAAAPKAPRSLLDQLKDKGRLIIPVGPRWEQVLELWQRDGNSFSSRQMGAVAFVPLRGKEGWKDDAWIE